METGKLNTIIKQILFGKKVPPDTEYPIISETDIRSAIEHCRNEIAICDMYVGLAKKHASKNKMFRQVFIEPYYLNASHFINACIMQGPCCLRHKLNNKSSHAIIRHCTG